MAWTTSGLLLLLGLAAGPYGLNLLSASVLLLLDPLVVMALGMLGVFIGLAINPRRPRPTAPAVMAVLGGLAMAALRDATPLAQVLTAVGLAGVAIVVAYAGWLPSARPTRIESSRCS